MDAGFFIFINFWLLFLGSLAIAVFAVLVIFKMWLKDRRRKFGTVQS